MDQALVAFKIQMEILNNFRCHKKLGIPPHINHLTPHKTPFRYPISIKNAKKGESVRPTPLMITKKYNLAKNGYGGKMLKHLRLDA